MNRSNLRRALVVAAALMSSTALAQVGPGSSPDPVTLPGTTPTPVVAPAPAVVTQADRDAVRVLLSVIHGLPDAAAFEAAVADPANVLWAIALDEDEMAFHRDRAVLALGNWPDERLWDLLVTRATGPSDDLNVHDAIAQLGRVYGTRAVPVVAPLLGADELQVRLSAVDALGRLGTIESRAALESARMTETSPIVIEQLDAAVATPAQ